MYAVSVYFVDTIYNLHNCPTVDSFKLASKLWLNKWKANEDAAVTSFVLHFEAQWLIDNSGWYQGIAPGHPTTNNALESFNAKIKKYHTLRARLPMYLFLSKMQ